MEALLIFFVVLGLIAVVGHLLWLAVAAVIRIVFFTQAPGHSARETVVRTELDELDITTRTIRGLLARGDLDRETVLRLEQSLEARRRSLQGRSTPPAAKVRPLTTGPSVEQLEQLLGGMHPRDLPPRQRQAALACYRNLNNSQKASLNAPTLLAVARLLFLAGLASRSLDAYRRLLDEHPNLPDRAADRTGSRSPRRPRGSGGSRPSLPGDGASRRVDRIGLRGGSGARWLRSTNPYRPRRSSPRPCRKRSPKSSTMAPRM